MKNNIFVFKMMVKQRRQNSTTNQEHYKYVDTILNTLSFY